jgi:HD superfamily phosphohydrolase
VRALYALEGAVLSYFTMFRAVYYHRTVRAAYLLFQDILWKAFEKGIFKNAQWEDPKFWNEFDDYKCYQLLKRDKEISEEFDLLLMRKLPKMIPKLKHPTQDKLEIICRDSQKKKEKEKELFDHLKNKWKLNMLFIDSIDLVPYPYEPPYPYILEENNEARRLHEKVPYLSRLKEAWNHEKVRVYVRGEEEKLNEKEEFIGELEKLIQS